MSTTKNSGVTSHTGRDQVHNIWCSLWPFNISRARLTQRHRESNVGNVERTPRGVLALVRVQQQRNVENII